MTVHIYMDIKKLHIMQQWACSFFTWFQLFKQQYSFDELLSTEKLNRYWQLHLSNGQDYPSFEQLTKNNLHKKDIKCKVGVDIKKWLEKIILSHLGYELQSDNKMNQIMIREMSSSYLHSPCSTLPLIGRITSAIQGQCRQF